MHLELQLLFSEHLAIARRDYPKLRNAIRQALAKGEIVPLLPGTYALEATTETRIAAVRLWDPDAVFVGGTAAKLSWWPELQHDEVIAVVKRQSKRRVKGIVLRSGTVDPDLVHEVDGVRLAHPAWVALELTDEHGGKAIDEALRRKATSLGAMRWALKKMPGRRGNVERARLLLESRDQPWSELEREAHVALREAKVEGWEGNARVKLTTGKVRYLDIALEQHMIAIEVDGWEFHKDYASFVDDRRKDVELTLEGWTCVRFTKETIKDLVPTVQQLIKRMSDARRHRPRKRKAQPNAGPAPDQAA